MLHIIQSNRMEVLQEHLSKVLYENPLSSLFSQEQVLVQSPGLAQWLKVSMTQQHGVTGQIEYILPSSYIWRLYQSLLTDIPDESSFNKQNMAWKLFSILPSFLEYKEFKELKQYLVDADTSQDNHIRRFALCDKIADVYDHYLMYRPDWLMQWELEQDQLEDVDVSRAPWQPILWRALVKHTKQLGQNTYHRANLHQALLDELEKDNLKFSHQNLHIFGLSAIPAQQLEIFQKLAKRINVYIYFCNPSEHYWGDVIDEKTKAKRIAKFKTKPNSDADVQDYYYVGNPLLASWGKLGREYLEQLIELEAQWTDYFDDCFSDTLLGSLQREIYQLAFKGEPFPIDDTWFVSKKGQQAFNESESYNSIQLATCHNALREVEALHDHLLNMFAADPKLTPKDVIVMMPNSGQYSPYIEAVFGSAKGKRYIPFAISDTGVEQEKPVVNSFIKLTQLSESRFYVSDILDLLQVSEVAAKFNISNDEFEQICYWLEQVNIRWGIDGEHKTQFDQPDIELNTWHQGLSRLLLGFAIQDESADYAGVYPADKVEGIAVESLAKLITFFDALIKARDYFKHSENIAEKVNCLEQLLMDFFVTQDSDNTDFVFIQKALDKLITHFNNGDFCGQISQQLLVHALKECLLQKGVGQRFLMGQVNFCTLMPMRAVPFKVVCILGLNDNDYPRNVQPLGFDLVQYSQAQKGDRSRKMDDRYLFLEALLSARQQVYLSYIANSCLDNSERIPSVLVTELTDYLARVFKSEKDDLISKITIAHHLQPFNPNYYSNTVFHSYNPTWLPETDANTNNQDDCAVELDIELPSQIDIDLFIRQLLTPQQSFYRHTIGAHLGRNDDANANDEVFAIDGLSNYLYMQEFIVQDYIDNPPNIDALTARGDLPYGAGAELAIDSFANTVTPLLSELKRYQVHPNNDTQHELLRAEINIKDITLSGPLQSISLGKQFLYRPTKKLKPKDKIRGYLYHLIGSASEQVNTTVFLSLEGYIEYEQLTQTEAMAQLISWLDLYLAMFKRPLPFFPESGFAYLKKGELSDAEKCFSGDVFNGTNELSDPYIELDFNTIAAVADEFITLTDNYIAPIKAIITEHKYAKS